MKQISNVGYSSKKLCFLSLNCLERDAQQLTPSITDLAQSRNIAVEKGIPDQCPNGYIALGTRKVR